MINEVPPNYTKYFFYAPYVLELNENLNIGNEEVSLKISVFDEVSEDLRNSL